MLHTPVSERGQDESNRWGSPVSRPGRKPGSRLFAAGGRDSQPSADSSATRWLRSQEKIAIHRAQSTYGNQAILRALNHSINSSAQILQRKCACDGSGGDCSACAGKEVSTLQRHAANHSEPNEVPKHGVPPIVHDVLRSPGQPLDTNTRAFMEPRFGRDLGGVRIHTDSNAAESARAVHARAYTVGHHVVFADGLYAPGHYAGQKLLAHELAHTIQQGGIGFAQPQELEFTNRGGVFEREATHAADDIAQGRSVSLNMKSTLQVARDQPDAGVPDAPAAPATPAAISVDGTATCDNGSQMFCNTGNKGCSTFPKGMTGSWAHICYKCGPKNVYHRSKDEGTGVVSVGCGDKLNVISKDNPDCSVQVTAIDHGPAKSTGNLIDLHPDAAQKLWNCAKGKKGKVACGNFKMSVSVSAIENTCP